jgi:hypothetical protein
VANGKVQQQDASQETCQVHNNYQTFGKKGFVNYDLEKSILLAGFFTVRI